LAIPVSFKKIFEGVLFTIPESWKVSLKNDFAIKPQGFAYAAPSKGFPV
jgi:hypothetical protein